jgi:hypothetical protein
MHLAFQPSINAPPSNELNKISVGKESSSSENQSSLDDLGLTVSHTKSKMKDIVDVNTRLCL